MLRDKDVLPTHGNSTFWSDYIEFRALCHIDKCFTFSDFDQLCESNRDTNARKWRDALNLSRTRASYFGESYPFEIPEDENDIILVGDNLEQSNKVYLSLLVCSCLKYIEKQPANSITREFEKFSHQVFKYMMPHGSIIKPNWANPDPGEDCYSGRLPDKLREINRDIRCSSDSVIKDEDFDPRNTGDGGIDLVAWHEMYDKRPGIPIAVGQCSCTTTEWNIKQIEGTYAKHGKHFPLIHAWSNFYFCPLDLRKSESNWQLESNIAGAIVVDRSRFVSFLSENQDNFELSCLEGLLSLHSLN